jgi:Ca2+-transporting ATPase
MRRPEITNLYDLLQGRIDPFPSRRSTQTGRSSAKRAAVVPVHTALKGRARLEVQGLRGSQAMRQAIEDSLRGQSAVLAVSANPLTGRVLVLYAEGQTLDAIVALISVAVRDARAPAQAAGPAEPLPEASARERPLPGKAMRRARAGAWHTEDAQAVLHALGTSATLGLSAKAARARLATHGPNRLPEPPRRSAVEILLSQFKSLPVLLLVGSAVLSVMTGGLADAIVVLGVVAINAGIGYVTESEAERTIESLTGTGRRRALVIRDGTLLELDTQGLVPGDLLVLSPGHYVTADARLLDARNLTVDESALTGESLPVAKDPAQLADPNLPLGDRVNMLHMGTAVTGGNGLGVVVATGTATEIGAIQTLVSEAQAPQTPMQRQLEQLGRQMVWLSLGICGGVFGAGMLRGYGLLPMLRAAVALAVAAVPEGLPAVATTTLALGIRSMHRHKVLVRRLDAVETLGSVQVICLDKTGTLTLNRMSVLALHASRQRIRVGPQQMYGSDGRIEPLEQPGLARLLQVAALCNETSVDGRPGEWMLNGSATESALVEMALRFGVDVNGVRARYPRRDVQYRAAGRNWMATLHEAPGGERLLAVKGSPAEVLAMCRRYACDGVVLDLDDPTRELLLLENERMAGEALRVLGFAYARLDGNGGVEPYDLVWVGLAGMADPVREGVSELIALFHQAGIRTVMITGDQSATAYAIGRELDLSGTTHLDILDSTELQRVDPAVLSALAQKVDVFSRVSPAHKLQIVQALQHAGKVVAMTGDGINDGPALKAADIGVAMGSTGTDVARTVADVVLEDDNLRTMIVAVREGRTIYANIRKSVHFLISTNLSEIGVMFTAIAAGLGQPLKTMQLLWINLLTDVFPALALAVEPPEPDVLLHPPRDPARPIIGRRELLRYGFEGGVMTLGGLAGYSYGVMRYGPGPQASTLAFNSLVAGQLLHAYSCRSEHVSIFHRAERAPNRWLHLAVGGSAALQALTLIVPGLRRLLGTAPVGPVDLAVSAAGAAIPFLISEATKGLLAPDGPGTPRRVSGGHPS